MSFLCQHDISSSTPHNSLTQTDSPINLFRTSCSISFILLYFLTVPVYKLRFIDAILGNLDLV